MTDPPLIEDLKARVANGYPSNLNPIARELGPDRVVLDAVVTSAHHAGNGYLHAGALVTLADTACGYGTLAGLPPGASGFTTIELKSNHLATITEGALCAIASRVHGGRTTQVWDAVITDESNRNLVLFRCTQMLLYPR